MIAFSLTVEAEYVWIASNEIAVYCKIVLHKVLHLLYN